MAHYTCPLCKKPFTAPAAAQVHCPHCQQAIDVPATGASRWFLARNKKKYGPYTWKQLQALSHDGEVRPADMLLQEGTRQWVRADAVPGLFPLARAVTERPKRGAPPASKKAAAPNLENSPQGSWFIAGLVSAAVCVFVAVCAIIGFVYFPSSPLPPPPIVHAEKGDGEQKDLAVVEPPKKIVPAPKDERTPDGKRKRPDEKKPVAVAHASDAEDFVERLNRHRKAAGLGPVTLDPELSNGCLAHAQYLARNLDPARPESLDDEDPKKPGYSAAGARAAQNAMIVFQAAAPALDRWMGRVFSRTHLLSPQMQTIGVGLEKNEDGEWFCVVDPVRGRGAAVSVYPAPKETDVPVYFSGGKDVPDADAVAGFPISVSLPAGKKVTAAHIELRDAGGKPIEGWVWTPEKQVPAEPKLNAMALIPRGLLHGETLYQVTASAQIDGKPWSLAWSFTTEDDCDRKGIWAKKALARVNTYRVRAGLKPVVLDDALTRACLKHARYLVINEGHPSLQGLDAHTENLKLPGASPEGDAAGRASDIGIGDYEPTDAVDVWMATLFHRVPILEPTLKSIGFGCARCQRQGWATVMNVTSGRDETERPHAVFYPAPDQTGVPLSFPNSGEEPNPIPDDKDGRAGFPVTASFPKKAPANAAATLTDDKGAGVPCWFSAPAKVANPKFASHQGNTVCLIAKDPLTPGTTYQVHFTGTLEGKAWEKKWKFTTIEKGLGVQEATRGMLERLNDVRAKAGLGAVTLDDGISRGCQLHAEYLAKNADALLTKKASVNDEDPQLPGFTADGLKAAGQSLVFSNAPTPIMQIDDLMATFTARLYLLDPLLQRVGIGCAHDIGRGWRCVLDPFSGRGEARVRVYPVPKQTDVPLLGFDRLDAGKDPLGFPITATFPPGGIIRNVQAALKDGKNQYVDVAISSPEKPLPEKRQGTTVAVHPRAPLEAGQTYAVTISAIVNGNEWRQSWSFTTQK